MKALDIYHQFADPENILLYQMGKVGSSTLESSLDGAIHAHSLFGYGPCPPAQAVKPLVQRLNIAVASQIKRMALSKRSEVKIICPIREPMTRNISMFFQDLPYWLCEYYKKSGRQINRSDAGMQLLVDAFESVFCHDYPTQWFVREMQRLTGIDVYVEPFDKKQGYSIIKRGRYSILVIKHDTLDANIELLSNFSGKPVKLNRTNTGNQKWYGKLYKDFLEMYQPDEDLLRQIHDSNYHKHFYHSGKYHD